ncbi:tetratricopeptide repeat protein [Kordia algicida OT-1]|uniref:Tetratricopeptide repeat protein n=1 Tax=Kordia algicida OT-1 TaxID=391587 RepID=A9DSH4_9FLAO|nr:tetratricopeptide repeat protein [Kordia algicida]EDP96935.1 tetratricopeptide repeat protein [Kordia algicida OT-1]
MNTKYILLFSFLFISTFGFAQNMKEGFSYLENGKYQQAETFFKTVLQEYPTNKTARLCYGRAVGLNGNAAEAKKIFNNLLKDFPNDFEVKLNYGESLLWNQEFDLAKAYYQKLVVEDAKSFPALLGFANTLSNLKEYDSALLYVNKALEVLPGNLNAMTSKKYIYLGNAYQKQQAQQYLEAEKILKECVSLFANDTNALLNLANLYLIMDELDKAKITYDTLLESSKNVSDKITVLNGWALIEHLKGKEKLALKTSQLAYDSLAENVEATVIQQTRERYIQALIWNKKYAKAAKLIDEIIKEQPNENWVLALRATLNVYKSNFKQSLADYDQILVNDSTSFDGNLGKANVLKALGRYDDAIAAAEKTLTFYNNQKDATNFIKELKMKFTPFYDGKVSYTFDNGDNEAFSVQNTIEFPFSTRLKLLGNYTYRTTNNTVTNNKATSHAASAGLSYQVFPNMTFKGTLGITSANAETNDFTQLLADFSLNIKPFKLQTLDIGYKREIQSFNADLLDREIVQNNLYANYNVSTNFNLGWFTQYYYTMQNDNNSRHLVFTSLYYNILSKPSLKVGLNYQYITFEKQVPSIYFSPKKFNAGEIFLNLIKDENITKADEWFYELTAATGLQYIEDQERQSTYRFQGKLGYKFSDRCMANVFGTRSNIASATAAGFTFTEVGIRVKWVFGEAKTQLNQVLQF